ncbi:MAG: EAL domain-containing protein [Actinomycetota bacterium]
MARSTADTKAPRLLDSAWSQGISGLRLQESDERVARRSRIASVVLALVLLAISVFAVWSSLVTSNAATGAVAANNLSDHYAQAARAVLAEESLERKYRLEPGPSIRTAHDASAASFVSALGQVRRQGDAGDRSAADRVLAQHRDYLEAVDRLFAAVDRGDAATVLLIDGGQVDPLSHAIQEAVVGASLAKRQAARDGLAHLLRLETLNRQLTPFVFLGGLVLVAVLVSITRGHRRLLDAERAHAVYDSLHDGLTGLPNRALLTDRLGQALRVDARLGTSTGVLLLDLDRFKQINDTFGHHRGDEVLTQVGPRLAGVVRDVDTVARLAGDEFVILLPDVGCAADATAVADSLRAAMETPFQVEGIDLDVEVSVGVVLSGDHGEDAAALLQRADVAMYVAKTQNLGVCLYDPAVDRQSPAKLALFGDFRRALDRHELVLHYQPKVNISNGDLVGAEALVYWQHPERGLVSPDEFIPIIEHTGLIGPLTRYVLDRALAQARAWSDAGRSLTVSVNLSARNLLDEGLPGQIGALLSAHGLPPELLSLEVTESAIMTEPARARQSLEQLAQLGMGISIDDFGAGYTSLGQLKYLPVSELKIDKSFVLTMIEDPSNALIVRSVVDLGHNLGFTLVAEGVETEQILIALADIGCDVAQGYHLSRPMAAADFDTWCAGRRITAMRIPARVSDQPANGPAGVDSLTLATT